LTAVSLAALSACGGTGSASSAGGSHSLKVGIIIAKTGPIAGPGIAFAQGGELAVEQVNADDAIGGGTKIVIDEVEGSEDPAKSASIAARMTADVNLAKPPYIFRTVTMPQPANMAMAEQLAKSKDFASVAYAVMTDNSGIVSQGDSFKAGMKTAGVKDLGTVGTLSTQTDFTSTATSLMAKSPEAIVAIGTAQNAVGVIAALHDKGYKGLVIAGETISGSGVFKSNPDALEPVPFPVYFLASEATAAGKAFAEAYKAKYGTDPDDFAAQGYNAIWTLAMAAKDAGDTSREALAKALGSLKSLDNTIYGTVTFKDGQLDASSNIKVVHYTKPDGQIAPYN
jgi:branched-chain amino acid transport system substrate-binding protein